MGRYVAAFREVAAGAHDKAASGLGELAAGITVAVLPDRRGEAMTAIEQQRRKVA